MLGLTSLEVYKFDPKIYKNREKIEIYKNREKIEISKSGEKQEKLQSWNINKRWHPQEPEMETTRLVVAGN